MQPIVPAVFRTGDPAVDRNLDEIAKAFRRLSDVVGAAIDVADDHKVMVDAGDTPVYAANAITAGTGIAVAKNGTVPTETVRITNTAPDDHKFSTDATDEAAGGAGYALSKLSSTGNVKPTLDTSGGQRRTRFDVTLPTGFPGYYDDVPEPVGGAGDPGDSALVSRGNHAHAQAPTPQVTSVYYLDPAPLQPLLVNPCPSVVDSLEFAFPTTSALDDPPTYSSAITLAGKPGLAEWPAGICNVVLRAKVLNIIGTTHQVAVDLYRLPAVGDPVRYCSAVAPWVGPTDILTGDIQVLRFSVPVKFLSGDAADLLGMTIYALPGMGGSVDTEIMYIETGADGSTVLVNDATQVQTLFGSSTGGPVEHEQTTGRDQPRQHPQSAVGVDIRVLSEDFATEDANLADVPDLTIDVEAGDYLIEAHLEMTDVTSGGGGPVHKVAIAGTATVASCLLSHRVTYWGSAAWTQYRSRTATFGDGGVATAPSAAGDVSWDLYGIIHVTEAGTIKLRANTGTGVYGDAAFILLDSTFTLTLVS